MRLGKQMQFFWAPGEPGKGPASTPSTAAATRFSGDQVSPKTMPVTGDFLDYDDVMAKFDTTMEWLAKTYVHA